MLPSPLPPSFLDTYSLSTSRRWDVMPNALLLLVVVNNKGLYKRLAFTIINSILFSILFSVLFAHTKCLQNSFKNLCKTI